LGWVGFQALPRHILQEPFQTAETNSHVGALQGPIARQTANTSGTFLGVHRWEWRS
jgi:hypothetical protein